MHLFVLPEPQRVLCVRPPELLDRCEVGLQVLDIRLQREHARVDISAHDRLQFLAGQVRRDGPLGEFRAHVRLSCALRLLSGPELAQEIERQLLILLPGFLQLVAPRGDASIDLLQRTCLFLHLVDEVDLLAFQRAGSLNHLVALGPESSEDLILLDHCFLPLVVLIQHRFGLIVELSMFLFQRLQRLLCGSMLLQRLLRADLRLLRVLHHVVRIEQRLLHIAPHVLALFCRLLELFFRHLELFAADVHDLIVQLTHLLFHGMVLGLDLVQLVRPAVDGLFKLLQLRLLVPRQSWHLQALQAGFVCLHLLLEAADVHLALLRPQVVLPDLLLRELQRLLQSAPLLADRCEPCIGLLIGIHKALHLLRAVLAERGAHAALRDLIAAATHGATRIDELAIERDHTPALTALHANPRGLL
mmetsp:Transcript_96610/g.207267  ORF Transcript_96610/g.207267 Transcript_96610/m.207267 type:complete len:417 (+) Transcript_96610:818-2068(+)